MGTRRSGLLTRPTVTPDDRRSQAACLPILNWAASAGYVSSLRGPATRHLQHLAHRGPHVVQRFDRSILVTRANGLFEAVQDRMGRCRKASYGSCPREITIVRRRVR